MGAATPEPDAADEASLAASVRSGDRRALARAITLVESTREDHRSQARQLLDDLLPVTGGSERIGFSGAPGVGKSTLIESLGIDAIAAGRKVAVLAVDPSSAISGGSILGDKTRMAELGRHDHAFIRPSPSAGTLGGVARRTGEALLLCEAAGFDLVLVETVGVGQSEVAVADLVDLFVLVASPVGGDELQGMKRGIMELADLIVVNKADGDLVPAATRAAGDLRNAVHLLRPKRPGWEVEVLLASATTGSGIRDLRTHLERAHARLAADGLADLRARQRLSWMWNEVTDTLMERVRSDPDVRDLVTSLEAAVADGSMSPAAAAHEVLGRVGPTFS